LCPFLFAINNCNYHDLTMASLKDILENTKAIYMTDSALDSLMDFERVIDELDVYVFDNWKKGELAEGPVYEKYFVTCTFMWPYKLMPDPRGGEKLLDYGCRVRYKKDLLEFPIKVKSPDDFEAGTKMPKMASTPIWLVEITMPKKLMQEIHQGSIELENEKLDIEDIEQAYETGMDDDVYKTEEGQNEAQPAGQPQTAAPAAPAV
jgi:hypothetical protein